MSSIPSCVSAPVIVNQLLLNKLFQVNSFVELVGFRAWIRYEAPSIERFCNLSHQC